MRNKRAQEEIIGFAFIIVLVAVIILVFLGISLNKSGNKVIESYEAESFIQSALQYTSSCQDNFGYVSVKEMISMCDAGERCLDGTDGCDAVSSTLSSLIESGWDTGPDSPSKGYSLDILSGSKGLVALSGGNQTSISQGTQQDLPGDLHIEFKVYS